MEVTAFCVWVNVFIVLILQTKRGCTAETIDAAFPLIFPGRLQFFEYETVTVRCELIDGVNVWKVMRKFHQTRTANSLDPCSSPEPSCSLDPAFEVYSGEYWCETDEGQRSNSVNISITAGLVILELPIQPVVEGSDVKLPCIHQKSELKANMKTELNHIRDFYKNGLHLMTCYSSNMALQNVTKEDEGYYKCSISGAGESPETWLAVYKPPQTSSGNPPVQSKHSKTLILQAILRFIFMAFVTAVIALIHCKRNQHTEVEGTADGTGPCLSEEEEV